MLGKQVLDLIWEGHVALPDTLTAQRFAAQFSSILPLRTAPLLAGAGVSRPMAMSDELELTAGLPLGDVLVEELPVDLSYDTVVLFLPRDQRNLGCLLGGAVAESLILAITMGDLPMERENEALHALAQAAMTRATELKAGGATLDLDGFRDGMAQSLGRHWLVDSSLMKQPDFLTCPEMLAHLSRLDPGFVQPDLCLFGSRLLDVSSDPLGFEDWTSRTSMMLRACMGTPEREFQPLEQDIVARFNFH